MFDTEGCPRLLPGQVVALALVFGTGVGLRMLGLERGLWFDEAWVLDSVRTPTLHAMFYYADWAQTTPPGMLLLLRSLRELSGSAPETLRLLPFLCGVLTLSLVARLSVKLLRGAFALPVLLVLALSPEIIWYATEIKQYAFDLLAMTAVLYFGWSYIQHPSRARLTRWFLLFAVFSLFSYTLVFALPAVALVAVIVPAHEPWQGRLRATLVLVGLSLALCVLTYLVLARPNAALPTLYAYWKTGFIPTSGYSTAYFLRRVVSEQAAFLPVMVSSPGAIAALLALACCGLMAIVRHWRGAAGVALAMLLTVPMATVMVANVMGLYPLSEFRMLYFLCVNVALVLGIGLQWLTTRLSSVLVPAPRQVAMHIAVGLCITFVCAVSLSSKPVRTVHGKPQWETRLEMLGAVRFLYAQDALARPLFVHASLRQLFKEYRREFPLTSRVAYGKVGWPCCIPGKTWTKPEFNVVDIARDTAEALKFIGPGTGYLVLRKNKDNGLGAEHDLYATAVRDSSCELAARFSFSGIQVLKVQCPGH